MAGASGRHPDLTRSELSSLGLAECGRWFAACQHALDLGRTDSRHLAGEKSGHTDRAVFASLSHVCAAV